VGKMGRTMSDSSFEGKVIYRSQDEFGDLIVAEGAMTRSLYFGEGARQSSMFVDFPDDLTMYYSRAMGCSLIFNPGPRKVLVIGLGGGSIVKFLLKACPGCLIEAVEIREKVIYLSHRFFALPENHKDIRIVNADGHDFIMRYRDSANPGYDFIFVDAYDDSGQVDEVADLSFIEAAKQCLSKNGILIYNLWNSSRGNYRSCHEMIKKAFESSFLQLILEGDKGHTIIFAFKSPVLLQDLKEKEIQARKLQEQFHINFPKFLDKLVKQNY